MSIKIDMVINTLISLLSETEDVKKMELAAPLHNYFNSYEGTPEQFLEEVATALVAATPRVRKLTLGFDPLDEERKEAVEAECVEYAFWWTRRYEKYLKIVSPQSQEFDRIKSVKEKTEKAVDRQIYKAFQNFSENEEFFGADNGFREWFGDEPESDL